MQLSPKRFLDDALGPALQTGVDEQGNRLRFTSELLPRYVRPTKCLGALIPWLYLKAVSTGDITEALAALGFDKVVR